MKKNCIIVHGCPPTKPKVRSYNKHWMPWLKANLSAQDIATETPLMPEPWQPDYEKFKGEFEKYEVNEDTILIGHSCGCSFLVRWLGDSKQKISKLILVGPWKTPDEGDESRKNFYGYDIDETIKERVKDIVMFTSDNEEAEGKESLKIFHNSLGGKIIELPGRGHYTENDMGTTEFPELLKEVVK